MSRGIARERALRDFLELCGWICVRVAGSLGPADLVAIAKQGAVYPRRMPNTLGFSPARGEILLVQVKGTSRPFANFGPDARRQLLGMANDIGAAAWLAHKPLGARQWEWFPPTTWPAAPRKSLGPPAAAFCGVENLSKTPHPPESG